MSIKAVFDVVILEKITEETTNSGLVVVFDNDGRNHPRGRVVAVGPGQEYENGVTIPLTVVVGDTVIYSEHAGQTIRHDGKELVSLREQDIYAIIET